MQSIGYSKVPSEDGKLHLEIYQVAAATPKEKEPGPRGAVEKRKRNKVKSHLSLGQVNVAHNSSESHVLLSTLRLEDAARTVGACSSQGSQAKLGLGQGQDELAVSIALL